MKIAIFLNGFFYFWVDGQGVLQQRYWKVTTGWNSQQSATGLLPYSLFDVQAGYNNQLHVVALDGQDEHSVHLNSSDGVTWAREEH